MKNDDDDNGWRMTKRIFINLVTMINRYFEVHQAFNEIAIVFVVFQCGSRFFIQVYTMKSTYQPEIIAFSTLTMVNLLFVDQHYYFNCYYINTTILFQVND